MLSKRIVAEITRLKTRLENTKSTPTSTTPRFTKYHPLFKQNRHFLNINELANVAFLLLIVSVPIDYIIDYYKHNKIHIR